MFIGETVSFSDAVHISNGYGSRTTSSTAHHTMVPPIQGSSIQVHIQGITVVSRIKQTAMAIHKKAQWEARLCSKLQITRDIFLTIHWEAHGWATKHFIGSQKFLLQFLHGMLPVGRRVNRYDSIQFSSNCPTCQQPDEDMLHLLTCQHESRRRWFNNTVTEIL
jgi:hypothetical protein